MTQTHSCPKWHRFTALDGTLDWRRPRSKLASLLKGVSWPPLADSSLSRSNSTQAVLPTLDWYCELIHLLSRNVLSFTMCHLVNYVLGKQESSHKPWPQYLDLLILFFPPKWDRQVICPLVCIRKLRCKLKCDIPARAEAFLGQKWPEMQHPIIDLILSPVSYRQWPDLSSIPYHKVVNEAVH
jgi:hypothetical protein